MVATTWVAKLLKPGTTWLARSSKAQVEQVGSVGVRRLGARLGQLPPAVIAELDKALRLHLGLWPLCAEAQAFQQPRIPEV